MTKQTNFTNTFPKLNEFFESGKKKSIHPSVIEFSLDRIFKIYNRDKKSKDFIKELVKLFYNTQNVNEIKMPVVGKNIICSISNKRQLYYKEFEKLENLYNENSDKAQSYFHYICNKYNIFYNENRAARTIFTNITQDKYYLSYPSLIALRKFVDDVNEPELNDLIKDVRQKQLSDLLEKYKK